MGRKKPRIYREPPPTLFSAEKVSCPACGFVGTWDDFDVAGAGEDCIFCNRCTTEFNPHTGELAPLPTADCPPITAPDQTKGAK
jgi:hypothetical protein